MYQVSGSYSARTLLTEIIRKLLQALGDIGGHNALLLNILGAPGKCFALAIQLVALQFHGSCQGDGSPIGTMPIQQDLWGSS